MKKLLALIVVIIFFIAVVPVVAQSYRYCLHPTFGEGWIIVDGSGLSKISGANEYCITSGDVVIDGCMNYSMHGNFEEVWTIVTYKGEVESACELEYWAYRLNEETPVPTNTPSPTNISRVRPTNTPVKILWTTMQLMGIDILISIIHSPDIPENIGEIWAAQYPPF